MIINFSGIVDDCSEYTGKSGWGANAVISCRHGKKRKSVEISIKDKEIYGYIEDKLGEEVQIEMILEDTKFGLRLGEILNVA